jgi:dTDP-4-dehydrorhamnose reductase
MMGEPEVQGVIARRIVVTGGSGQLARAIHRFFTGYEVILPDEKVLDLSDPSAMRTTLHELRPEVVINAGAFTQVDRCETEEGLAMQINGCAVGHLAKISGEIGALLVQISTDYVFDGRSNRPYREEDPVNPISVYGESKLLGETEARKAPAHLILRTAWLYDAWGNNFLNTMLKLASEGRGLKVVNDQHGAPTTCRALVRQMQGSLDAGWRGTVHATCTGETTWYGFAAEIFRQRGLAVNLDPCVTEDFPRPALRPAYSVLSGERRRELGPDLMPAWQEALAEVLADLPPGGRS